MKDGYQKTYFPYDGLIESEGEYFLGRRNGLWKFYYDKLDLRGEDYYEDTLKMEIIFDSTLELRMNGEKVSGDIKDGPYKEYFLGRKLQCEGEYFLNLKDGIWTYYSTDEKLIKIEIYEKGKLVNQKKY
jgi:antitoxin component YwqK of YwqJK toxin-antitoxin module